MRLVVNIEPRRHPNLQDTIGIFLRPLARGSRDGNLPTQSDLDRLSQTGIYSLGIDLGLYFNFIYADDLLAALKVSQLMGYRWAYIINGSLLGGVKWLQQTKTVLDLNPRAEFALWKGPKTPNNCPQEVLVGETQRLVSACSDKNLTINWAGEFTAASNVQFVALHHQPDIHFSKFYLDDGSSLADNSRSSDKPRDSFNAVFTTGNEEPDASQFKKFSSLKLASIVAPASGFYVNNLLGLFNNYCGVIHYYDASPQALNHKKLVNETWTPFSPLPQIPESGVEKNDGKDLFSPKIFHSEQEINHHWSEFKKIPKTYCGLNLIENPEMLIEWVAPEGHPLIWLSNVFTYSLNLKLYSLDDIQYSFLHLIRLIKKRNPDAIVAGRMPSGRYCHDYAKDVYMGISNFNFF